ncbi:MAG: hypothetical protein HQL07_14680 [Nitrospirae bacterium]|nr:hypothetical protein [Magnetococcales bacterium]HAT51579.1 hypothetical protein [Alphaproteobacteria bacterium]
MSIERYDQNGYPIFIFDDDPIEHGSKKGIYKIASRGDVIAKVIFEDCAAIENQCKRFLELGNEERDHSETTFEFSWPKALLYDEQKRFCGFTMAAFYSLVPLSSLHHSGSKLLKSKQDNHWRSCHEAGLHLAQAMVDLHHKEIFSHEIIEDNLMLSSKGQLVWLGVDNLSDRESDAASLWASLPSDKKYRKLQTWDAFSLGITLFKLLMQGHHPFQGQWRGKGHVNTLDHRTMNGLTPYHRRNRSLVRPPRNAPLYDALSPELISLFDRLMVLGTHNPTQCPTPQEWVEAFTQTLHNLPIRRPKKALPNPPEPPPFPVEPIDKPLTFLRRNRFMLALAFLMLLGAIFLERRYSEQQYINLQTKIRNTISATLKSSKDVGEAVLRVNTAAKRLKNSIDLAAISTRYNINIKEDEELLQKEKERLDQFLVAYKNGIEYLCAFSPGDVTQANQDYLEKEGGDPKVSLRIKLLETHVQHCDTLQSNSWESSIIDNFKSVLATYP